MKLADEFRDILKSEGLEYEIKYPFIENAVKCIRAQAIYAAILMLGVSFEAFIRLLAKRLEKLDKNILPYFKKRILEDHFKENILKTYEEIAAHFNEQTIDEKQTKEYLSDLIKRKKLDAQLNRLENMKKEGRMWLDLSLSEIIEIFENMKLVPASSKDEHNPFFIHNLKNLRKMRNGYAHPKWNDLSQEFLQDFLNKLKTILKTRIEKFRFAEYDNLIKYLIENSITSSKFVDLFPQDQFSTASEMIFEKAIETHENERTKYLKFWLEFKTNAIESEDKKNEEYFLRKLKESVDGDPDAIEPEYLLDFVDWSGSEDFCSRCAEMALSWAYDRESDLDFFEKDKLEELQIKVEQLYPHFPDIWLPGLNEISGKIQKKLAINDLLATLKQIAQKDKEQTL